MTRLTRDELVARYRDHDSYVRAWTVSCDALVRDGWLLADDAARLRPDDW
jgi:hypothetical protein